jgi:DNA-directed RNA polymerase sigma subunit (sigma70/sigma32)
MPIKKRWTPTMLARALKMYDAGHTLQEVGYAFGVGRERARQVLFLAKANVGRARIGRKPK